MRSLLSSLIRHINFHGLYMYRTITINTRRVICTLNYLLDIFLVLEYYLTMTTFIKFLAVVALIFAVCILIVKAVESEERSECLKWQRYSETIEDFYLTAWQADQCESYKVYINAPVY